MLKKKHYSMKNIIFSQHSSFVAIFFIYYPNNNSPKVLSENRSKIVHGFLIVTVFFKLSNYQKLKIPPLVRIPWPTKKQLCCEYFYYASKTFPIFCTYNAINWWLFQDPPGVRGGSSTTIVVVRISCLLSERNIFQKPKLILIVKVQNAIFPLV